MIHTLLFFAMATASQSHWLDAVVPIMTGAEKRAYQSLTPEAKSKFEENFWTEKAITADEYFHRLQYVDSAFGSTKTGSGATTDQGRVYLTLGAPNKITHIPSSRVFAPLEIWYYNTAPELHLETELHLIFYQRNSIGLPRLYSPTLDTIRALLLPQSSTRTMFGPNDSVTESSIRSQLMVGPAEDEVITAAVGVAQGIKTTGNDELLALATSPETVLGKTGVPRTEVRARFIAARPKLTTLETPGIDGARQIDLALEATAAETVDLQVLEGPVSLYRNQVKLNFERARAIQYTHRLDLLPGAYTLVFTVDGKAFPYPLDVNESAELIRANQISCTANRPFTFNGQSYELTSNGRWALFTTNGPVTWTVRKGLAVVNKTTTEGNAFEIPSGPYTLEASANGQSKTLDLTAASKESESTVVSFNANLQPAQRHAFVGHQWLLKGDGQAARRSLERSLETGGTKDTQIELARAEAISGSWDAARERIRRVLAQEPNNFAALTVLAFVETKLQDYEVAAHLYRRALAVQDSPEVRQALTSLNR